MGLNHRLQFQLVLAACLEQRTHGFHSPTYFMAENDLNPDGGLLGLCMWANGELGQPCQGGKISTLLL